MARNTANDEVCQIVIAFIGPLPALVMRYASLKRGELACAKLVKKWEQKSVAKDVNYIQADMFSSWVDLSQVASISFVDHAVRDKFVAK